MCLLFAKKPSKFSFFVKDNYIVHEEFGAGVKIAVVECYVNHSNINNLFTVENKNDILRQVGELTVNLNEIFELRNTSKWQEEQHQLAEGDLVIEVDTNQPRGSWKLAIVEQVHPSDDTKVRKVTSHFYSSLTFGNWGRRD